MFYNSWNMQEIIRTLDDMEILDEFSKHENPEFRFNCLLNASIPLEMVLRLCIDKDRLVKQKAATNTKLTPLHIIRLSRDYPMDAYLASGLAKNPNCPLELQHELADHPNWIVREFLAYNPNCFPELREKLKNDENEVVRSAANNFF